MSDYEEMLAVFKAGFRARFDAPGLLKPEGDEAIRAGVRAVVDALVKERDLWKSDEVKKMAALLRQDAMVFGPHTYKSSFRWHAADCLEALEAGVEELRAALKPFAQIKADDGDTFDTWNDDVIIRCEVTVGDLKKARSALEAKP